MKWIYSLALAASVSLAAVSAFAQQWGTPTGSTRSGGLVLTKAAVVLSPTVPTPVSLTLNSNGVPIYNKDFYLSAVTSLSSATLVVTFYDESGAQMFVQTVTATTTPANIVSYTAPIPFAAVKVSTSSALTGTNSVSLSTIEVHR